MYPGDDSALSLDEMSERPLRILHVITKLDVGGAQSVVQELVLQQLIAGHNVQVATGVTGPVSDALSARGVTVTVLPELVHPLAPTADRSATRALSQVIRDLEADVVHTHSSKGGLVGRAAARRRGVPSVYTAHGWPFQRGAPAAQRIKSLLIEWVGGRLGDEVVCVNEYELRLANRLRVGRKHHRSVIANGIADAPNPNPSRRVRSVGDPFHVVMVARLSPPKRPDLVVAAVAVAGADIHLTLVGDGELAPAIHQQVALLGLTDRVSMPGVADPQPFLEAAHAFCLMSDYEGSPMTVLEAMRAGLPVIASNLPGIAEAVGPDAGFLCADAAEVSSAIRRLADDPVEAARAGRAARARWEQRFTASRMADGYEALYRSLCS